MLEDLLTTDDFDRVSNELSWVELAILILFLSEILGNSVAFGLHVRYIFRV